MPTSPQQAAGMRIEPMPSLPCATGTMPAATAAADPPDEPPGVRAGSHGLRVMPKVESVVPKTHSSGTRVMPTTTAPAVAQPAHDLVVLRPAGPGRCPRAVPHRLARDGDVVLDRDRDAGERQRVAVGARVDRVGLAQRREDAHLLERADLGVARPRCARAPARRPGAR